MIRLALPDDGDALARIYRQAVVERTTSFELVPPVSWSVLGLGPHDPDPVPPVPLPVIVHWSEVAALLRRS